MKKEQFNSRFGFLLLAAGCSIGIGNFWRFPYMCSRYGGIYILFYIIFLLLLGIPMMTMELAVGRGSKKTVVGAFAVLEQGEQRWHPEKYISVAGNFLILGSYIPIGAWSFYYFFQTVLGKFETSDKIAAENMFRDLTADPLKMLLCALVIVITSFLCCRKGLKEGVERIGRTLVLLLFGFLLLLGVYSVLLDGTIENLLQYVKMDWGGVMGNGFWKMVESAMNQALFSLSLGLGMMTLLGSFLDDSHSLMGESIWITGVGTAVSLLAGFVIISVCFSFGTEVTAGPQLAFWTLPSLFHKMPLGRIWGSLFFLILLFSVWSTVIVVFQNLTEILMEQWGWERKRACKFQLLIFMIIAGIIALGLSLFSKDGDYGMVLSTKINGILSNFLLPLGALAYIYECVSKSSWGFSNFRREANKGKGPKIPPKSGKYLQLILPGVIIILMIIGWLK